MLIGRANSPIAPISGKILPTFFTTFYFFIPIYCKVEQSNFIVRVATLADIIHATTITDEMASSARARGTGIAQRSPDYITKKIMEGKAVIALTKDQRWAGFCYIEAWGHDQYVANSGLIVSPEFRKSGLARAIKKRIFDLSREKYPHSKIFGLTTGLAVMKINSELGYEPVTYSELTDDENFWAGCKSCVNYDILMSKGRKNCLCTAMLYDPKDHENEKIQQQTARDFDKNSKLYERFMRIKKNRMFEYIKKKKSEKKSLVQLLSIFNF